jgi:aminopeptidase YwaD
MRLLSCFLFISQIFTLFLSSEAQDISYASEAQDISYAHKIIDTLASPSMHGRGYVQSGDKIAANYLLSQFKKLHLDSFKGGYFQNFSFAVNTFPSVVKVKVGNKELIPGKDFIVHADCPSVKGNFEIADSLEYLSEAVSSKKFYLLNRETKSPGKPGGLIFIKKKLTWDVATQIAPFCSIELLDSAQPLKSKKISVEINSRLIKNYKTQNILAYIKGSQYPDSFIVFTAHYDHLGQMGEDVYFPGANDNASGCAMLLNLARHYSGCGTSCSIVFIAFGAEEAGLIGSKYYVEHPVFSLKEIKFLINLDLLGTGDEGIGVVNGSIYKKELDALVQINKQKQYLSVIKIRGKAANSDHYFFTEKGVKSFFIYTLGGIKAYHDIYDKPETLPLTKFEGVFGLLTDFTNYLQKN